jgi:hypothetical protein
MRTYHVALAALLVVAIAAASHAQPSRSRPPSPAEARAQFQVIVEAAAELATLAPPGRLRDWDRRWRARLHGLGRAGLPSVPSGPDCVLHEVAQLLGGTAVEVWNARMFLGLESLGSLVRDLARRRVAADRAARRRREGQSCADLPSSEPPSGPLQKLLKIARRGQDPTP